jgi:hypothetical protein
VSQPESQVACRAQLAAMLFAYHQALNSMLSELVTVLPEVGKQGREPYRQVVQRFTVNVLALSSSWSQP